MIQAGTSSTGSAYTLAVLGWYWISSASALRITTWPGVQARLRPGTKASAPTGGSRPRRRTRSSLACAAPRSRFMPPWRSVCSSTSGLDQGWLLGATPSSSWRAMKATTSSWCGSVPGTRRVACCHQCWVSRKAWAQLRKGSRCQAGAAKRRSPGAPGATGMSAAAVCVGVVCCSMPSSSASGMRTRCSSSAWRLSGAPARWMAQSVPASNSDSGERPRPILATAASRQWPRVRSRA